MEENSRIDISISVRRSRRNDRERVASEIRRHRFIINLIDTSFETNNTNEIADTEIQVLISAGA